MISAQDYIVSKYKVDLNQKQIDLPYSRWKEYPVFLKELGVRKMVELGVYKGQFTATLKKANPDMEIIGVDAWTVYPGYKDYGEHDLESTAYQEAQDRAKIHNFKLIKGWSMDVVNQFEDESLDAVFIDGNHDFVHVVNDTNAWAKKVRRGGIVSGHDFFRNHHKGFGVKEAIPAYCEAYGIRPLFVWKGDKCPSWMYVKP